MVLVNPKRDFVTCIMRWLLIISILLLLLGCKKDPDPRDCSKYDEYHFYPRVANFSEYVPISIGDTLIYVDSLNNEFPFIATNYTKDTIRYKNQGEVSSCFYDIIEDHEEESILLESSAVNWNIKYLLKPNYGGSESLFLYCSNRSSAYFKIPLGLNKLDGYELAFNDSLLVLNKMFYNVYTYRKSYYNITVHYTKNEGIVAFDILDANDDSYFFRKK